MLLMISGGCTTSVSDRPYNGESYCNESRGDLTAGLPATSGYARSRVSTWGIRYQKLEYAAGDGDIEIKYANGIEAKFNEYRDREQIQAYYAPLPGSVIGLPPVPARTFIDRNYNRTCKKLKQKYDRYVFKPEGSIELVFDRRGNLSRIEDRPLRHVISRPF